MQRQETNARGNRPTAKGKRQKGGTGRQNGQRPEAGTPGGGGRGPVDPSDPSAAGGWDPRWQWQRGACVVVSGEQITMRSP